MDNETSRRDFLRKTGAAGSVVIGVGLAGCENADDKMDDDPNPYDYEFVEGDELARDLVMYDEEQVTTHTTLRFDKFLQVSRDEYMRKYTATPDDTIQTFPAAEHVDGPIYQELGEELDTEAHHDVPIQIYGFVDTLSNFEPTNGAASYVEPTFMVEDAKRIE